jgi:hypothetical protein
MADDWDGEAVRIRWTSSTLLSGTFRTWRDVGCESVMSCKAEVARGLNGPAHTSVMAGSGSDFMGPGVNAVGVTSAAAAAFSL